MMKSLFVTLALIVSYAFAEDFSIYPLTPAPLELGVQLEPFQSVEGYELEFPPDLPTLMLKPFSMRYVYPDQTTFYTMQLIEPDRTTEFSVYAPDLTAQPPEFELELPSR
jgi:hypothetical protein